MAETTSQSPPPKPPTPAAGDDPPTPPTPPAGADGAAARSWRLPTIVVAVIAVLVLGVGGIVVLTPWDTTVAPDPARVAELEEEAADRDDTQIGDLTAQTEQTRDALAGVAAELREARDAGEEPADPTALASTVEEAGAPFADPPSGTTEHNLAWNGVDGAVGLFAAALDAHVAAGQAEGDLAAELRDHADSLTDLALASWEVAAGQVEVLAAAVDQEAQLSLSAATTDDSNDADDPDSVPDGGADGGADGGTDSD